MRSGKIIKIITGSVLFFCLPFYSIAGTGKTLLRISIHTVQLLVADTLPPVAKPSETTEKKPVANVIKVVPKVRKQAVPVKVNIKPIIIVKPKIIKPIIKIIH